MRTKQEIIDEVSDIREDLTTFEEVVVELLLDIREAVWNRPNVF